jgi:hypothetical protein
MHQRLYRHNLIHLAKNCARVWPVPSAGTETYTLPLFQKITLTETDDYYAAKKYV